jgi:hypothetical protein
MNAGSRWSTLRVCWTLSRQKRSPRTAIETCSDASGHRCGKILA